MGEQKKTETKTIQIEWVDLLGQKQTRKTTDQKVDGKKTESGGTDA